MPFRTISFAIFNLSSARNPHVSRVCSGFCTLSEFKLTASITPTEIGS
ncbi:L-asparaginase [Pectobacterium polaris]|nr:L-asparaginase [Pectobacterium polaris]